MRMLTIVSLCECTVPVVGAPLQHCTLAGNAHNATFLPVWYAREG